MGTTVSRDRADTLPECLSLTWTKGNFGVQHLGGHPSLDDRTYQVTIENHGSCTGWHILALRGGHAFTPIREDTAPSPERAREAAEKAFLAIVGIP